MGDPNRGGKSMVGTSSYLGLVHVDPKYNPIGIGYPLLRGRGILADSIRTKYGPKQVDIVILNLVYKSGRLYCGKWLDPDNSSPTGQSFAGLVYQSLDR